MLNLWEEINKSKYLLTDNNAQLSYPLVKSLKQNGQLMEGNQHKMYPKYLCRNDKANEDAKKRIKVKQSINKGNENLFK